MTKKNDALIETGVRNLDAVFAGGLPKGSATVIAGPPGSGKTILTQQICFHNASARQPVLFFNTLSEPTAKTLRYLKPFSFFDAKQIGAGVQFHDLGGLLRQNGLEVASRLIMEEVKRVKPAIVVIDSFKALEDFAISREELRKFSYELAVNLMAWETTTFLLGEYGAADINTSPLFSIVDGLVIVSQREQSGEQQRFIQIVKMRGANHSRDEHSFQITKDGIEVFAPRVTIRREDRGPGTERCKTGISHLDAILGEGIPRGSSLLVGGVAGTGKTILLLEFLYRGAMAGEKGIIFSFEETPERLRATARGLGWDLDREINRGMLEIVFIPQPEIMVEKHLLMIQERVHAFQARRVAIDSVSVFLHKLQDPRIAREKTFQLASIIQNSQAVGLFATDIPYGSGQISRFGVEETVVDGVLLLSSTEEDLARRRYLEVYKLRNTSHLKGRHSFSVGSGGITLFPRYDVEADLLVPPPPLEPSRRLSWGISGLDELCGGGLLERSATLVSGSAGIGKSTLGLQFIVEGAKRNEPGLYVSLEEGPSQLLQAAEGLGLPLREWTEKGRCELMYLSREQVRASQVIAILADKIQSKGIRRLVLDGVTNIVPEGKLPEELQRLLSAIVTRFKTLGVTSLLTIEASSMYPTGTITDRNFSLVADNIVLLRYVRSSGEDRPTVSVVKTRSSEHDRGTYHLSITKGGIQIGERVDGQAAASPQDDRSPG
ncbi:MAG: ATPase domain-containing protein [Myxococcaceae bacterium]